MERYQKKLGIRWYVFYSGKTWKSTNTHGLFVSSKKVGNVTMWFEIGYFQMQFEVEILVDHPKTFAWVKRILCLQVKKGFVLFKTSSKCIYTNIDFQQNQQGFTRNWMCMPTT